MNKILIGLLFSLVSTLSFAATGAKDKEKIQVADNAPDSYVIVKGDTLWAISGKFLKQPWRWPEVWRMNKDQIHNPHLIFPGQVVVLDRNGPTLSIGSKVSTASRDERVSPRVYESSAEAPITSVPMELIRRFLVEPLVAESGDERGLPTIVAMEHNQETAATGQLVFAKSVGGANDQWSVYRRSEAIKNPATQEVLGYQAMYLGSAQLLSPAQGDTAGELRLLNTLHEVTIGDRLAPAAKAEALTFAPHAPSPDTQGYVAGIYGGVEHGGRYSVIVTTLGKNDGIEPGHVLAINTNRGKKTYKDDGRNETYTLPDGRNGLAFVFRVFGRVSYALVMDSTDPVQVGDKLLAP